MSQFCTLPDPTLNLSVKMRWWLIEGSDTVLVVWIVLAFKTHMRCLTLCHWRQWFTLFRSFWNITLFPFSALKTCTFLDFLKWEKNHVHIRGTIKPHSERSSVRPGFGLGTFLLWCNRTIHWSAILHLFCVQYIIYLKISHWQTGAVIVLPLLIYARQSFSIWSDSSDSKVAQLRAQIALCTLKQTQRDITCHWIEVKSWIIPGAAELEIMRQPNYADNCVAASPVCGVSDTDKCLSVAAQAALATFSEQQRGVTAEGGRVLLLPSSGWRQMSNNR